MFIKIVKSVNLNFFQSNVPIVGKALFSLIASLIAKIIFSQVHFFSDLDLEMDLHDYREVHFLNK